MWAVIRPVQPRQIVFSAKTSTFPIHQAPRIPAAGLLSEAAGTVTIDWDVPDDVTDIVEYVVRRTSGYSPVAYDDEGTAPDEPPA